MIKVIVYKNNELYKVHNFSEMYWAVEYANKWNNSPSAQFTTEIVEGE